LVLTEEEKEYILSLLEWRIADHEGLNEWKKYQICKNLMIKIGGVLI
jgi:hypothetical protein